MGYEKGRGLGKSQEGRAEPLELHMRTKRTGLGLDEDKKRKREEATRNQAVRELKRQQLGAVLQKDFAEQKATKLAERRYGGQLISSRKVIETLDRRKGFEQSFLWPPPEEEKPEDGGVEGKEEGNAAEEAVEEEPPKEASWEDQPVKDKLVTALTYLRNHHNYCLHCGCQYDDPGDLQQNCPGLMDEDH